MDWLTGNWYVLLGPVPAHVALAIAAIVASFIIGYERFRKEKPVGFRTLGLVSVGSCIFVMAGIAVSPYGSSEAGRVIAQIISGIGFLGAGVILRGKYGVTGLTSAATIWAMAAVGSAIGAGYGGGGLAASGLMWVLLTVASRMEGSLLRTRAVAQALVRFESRGGKTALRLEEMFDDFHIPPQDQVWACTLDPLISEVSFKYHHLHRHHRECLARLADMDEVIAIERDDAKLLERLG
ncbi:MAG: MgtC/SapB family protein [Verrucomicrobia bacterium]|nr:MgtC/SapB family protein [Verrucomicrobiota bacterium]